MNVLPSGLPDVIDDDELLARFVTSSRNCTLSKNRVKFGAFLPDTTDDETSAFRVVGLDEFQITEIGLRNVPDGHFHCAGAVKAVFVRRLLLEIFPDEPPDRHCVFRNWPVEEGDEVRTQAKRNLIALKLAEEAQFVRFAQAL